MSRPRYLDELSDAHAGADGHFTEALSGLLVQSDQHPPPWVEPEWVREPDIFWRVRGWPIHRPKRLYVFTNPEPLDPETWIQHVKAARMRPERRAVAQALAVYADFETGRNVRPSTVTVAKSLGRGRANVNRHISALRRDGWLGGDRQGSAWGDRVRADAAQKRHTTSN